MNRFWELHDEAVITTIIGIIASIYFYYKAKKDGDKTANEYKRHYEQAEKDIVELKKKLDESIKTNKDHFNISVHHGDIIKNINERFDSRNNVGQEIRDIDEEFKDLLNKDKLVEAENYLIGKKPLIKDASIIDYMDANLKIKQSKIAEAIELLDKVTEADNGSMELEQVYALKAVLYDEHMDDPFKALEEWKQAAKINKSINYEVSTALCYMRLNQYSLAKERLEAASKFEEHYPSLWLVYAKYNREVKNYDEALEQVERAHSLGLVTPGLFVTKGLIQEDKLDFDNAFESYRTAIKLSPNHRDAVYNLANLYIKVGNLQQAEIELNSYRRKYPDDLHVLGSYFYLLSITNRNKRVIEIGERLKVIDHIMECDEAINSLGLAYFETGEIEKSKECFEQLLAVYPQYIAAFKGLYLIYSSKKFRNFELAEHYCNKELELYPDSTVAWNHKALIYALRQDFDNAYKLFNEALEITPNDDLTTGNIAMVKQFENMCRSEPDLEKRKKLEIKVLLTKTFNPLNEKEQEDYVK